MKEGWTTERKGEKRKMGKRRSVRQKWNEGMVVTRPEREKEGTGYKESG